MVFSAQRELVDIVKITLKLGTSGVKGTQPKRPRNLEWFNEKMQLAQAQEAGTDDLDAFDSDCDEALLASAILMAKLFAFDSDYSEQPVFVNGSTIDITSDSYLKENESEVVQDTNSSEQQDSIIMSVIEEMSNQVTKCNAVNQEHKTVNELLTAELERYKEQCLSRKHAPISVIDTKETLMLAEESRLKMNAKQNDKIVKEKKVKITPITP
ncbi:hypothetical protein Tco_1391570 [Tanacetum coccineum]